MKAAMSRHLGRITFRGALVLLMVTNFAGRFLESNGLFYSICSAVFMGALFEISRWGFVIDPDQRVKPGLASLMMVPIWAVYVLSLLALWLLVAPTVDSPYAAWWMYRSSNAVGLYLWNATFAAYFAFAAMRAVQLLLRGVLWVGVEMMYGSKYGGRSPGYAPPVASSGSEGNDKDGPGLNVHYDRLHAELWRAGLAGLATLLLFLGASMFQIKYPNELQNHIGVFATLYGAIIVVQSIFSFGGGRTDRI